MNHLTGVYCCVSIKHLKVQEKGGKPKDFKSLSAKPFTQGLLCDGEDLNCGVSDGFRWNPVGKEPRAGGPSGAREEQDAALQ